MEIKKQKIKLSKETVNIIRTTQRNNIELTNIADNKANVLLSLNGIMITFLIPLILANMDAIFEKSLHIPLFILGTTCFATIYLSAMVLRPSRFEKFRDEGAPNEFFSPFFFGNFYNMKADEFFDYIKDALLDKELIKHYLAQDMFYIGRRLGYKMTMVRRAFNIFLGGLFLSLLSTIGMLVWGF